MNIQFKKGVLELCVLAMLSNKDRYGYELVNEISRNIAIAEGTIYPLLRRLKDEGYLTTYIEESSEGPARKYYQLTDLGRTTKDDLIKEWQQFVKGVTKIIEESEDSNE
ncbi:MAG TPA: PadR family transcriptional regulator [Bacillota bacterium]|nr:PadR family transcriptional regulator [Bacillota bacterium]HOL08630.1 PadR family transcriptional regulator [Bacillota bacterium]HPO96668.1 PadR family transcriptional regulator [Bacillota bacterium]